MVASHVAGLVLLISTSMLALGWLWQAVAALRGVPTMPDLIGADGVFPDLNASPGPDVTVIVPACNEEDSIETTLRSLLASTGVRLQIVAVNDRSTDRTGARLDAIAAEVQAAGGPHSLEVIHNHELPVDGWARRTPWHWRQHGRLRPGCCLPTPMSGSIREPWL